MNARPSGRAKGTFPATQRMIRRALALFLSAYATCIGAATLAVTVEKMDAAAVACGISETQLQGLALRAVEDSPFTARGGANGSLSVRVVMRPSRRNSCTARISVLMKAVARSTAVTSSRSPVQRKGRPVVVLCNETDDHSAPKATFPPGIQSLVEYRIRQCLDSLKY